MFRTLRERLILSHILPFLLIVPLMGLALAWILETQLLLPQLTDRLATSARLLAEITRTEFELLGNPYYFTLMLDRVRIEPGIVVEFLDPQGRLLYSNDPTDASSLGQTLPIAGLAQAESGQEFIHTNYSVLRLQQNLIDILTPVLSADQTVIGIVRVTYSDPQAYQIFAQMRALIGVVLVAGLLLGGLSGYFLAYTISKPVQQVTQAIYNLASAGRRDPLQETGSEEIRNQIRAVNFLIEELDSLERARRQLLANLVHELGRPLGALRSAFHALTQGARQDPLLYQELVSGMDEELGRLQHVVEDLAHLHDQAFGQLELNREPVAMADWLPRVLRPWQEAAVEKRLSWETEIPADLPSVKVDPVRLGQVIGNLLSNAIRYTPVGRSIKVSAGSEDGQFWVQVSDTGPGIPLDEQEKIFTPFYRGDQTRRIKQGMGLGLSIARDLAVAHGGSLEVESSPGSGSTFTVRLPCEEAGNNLSQPAEAEIDVDSETGNT